MMVIRASQLELCLVDVSWKTEGWCCSWFHLFFITHLSLRWKKMNVQQAHS